MPASSAAAAPGDGRAPLLHSQTRGGPGGAERGDGGGEVGGRNPVAYVGYCVWNLLVLDSLSGPWGAIEHCVDHVTAVHAVLLHALDSNCNPGSAAGAGTERAAGNVLSAVLSEGQAARSARASGTAGDATERSTRRRERRPGKPGKLGKLGSSGGRHKRTSLVSRTSLPKSNNPKSWAPASERQQAIGLTQNRSTRPNVIPRRARHWLGRLCLMGGGGGARSGVGSGAVTPQSTICEYGGSTPCSRRERVHADTRSGRRQTAVGGRGGSAIGRLAAAVSR